MRKKKKKPYEQLGLREPRWGVCEQCGDHTPAISHDRPGLCDECVINIGRTDEELEHATEIRIDGVWLAVKRQRDLWREVTAEREFMRLPNQWEREQRKQTQA